MLATSTPDIRSNNILSKPIGRNRHLGIQEYKRQYNIGGQDRVAVKASASAQ